MDQDKSENGRKVTRKQLLLSVEQMAEENYPLPFQQDKIDEDFVYTKKKYAPVTANSPMFALDCEMCLTSAFRSELTRVSIVSEKGEVIYDELVKPWNKIYNYLTKYSGITKQMLDPVTKRLKHVQKEIRKLLPDDAILCGQSLGNDLSALKMFHPYVIDTSVIYNLSGNRKVKCSLRRLAFTFLGRVIQESKSGHCSAEDAKATMDLVQLKLRETRTFGDAVLGGDVSSFLPGGDVASAPSNGNAASAPPNGDVAASLPNGNAASVPPSGDAASVPPDEDAASAQLSSVYGFSHEPVHMRSLFDILNEKQVSACQVGRERLVSKYREEPDLKCCQVSNDQEACLKAAELSGHHKFTWVEFSAFADLLATQEQKENSGEEQSESDQDTEERKGALKTIDGHIQGVVDQLREKSLVVVALTGRGTQQHHEHAATFLHIT